MFQTQSINGAHPIIIDFIKSRDYFNGFGYFRGNKEAMQYAQAIDNKQESNFMEYGIIPESLVRMIGQYFIFPPKKAQIYQKIRYDEFLTVLMRGNYKNEAVRHIGEKLYHDLLDVQMPSLERSFAMMDDSYKQSDN